MHVVINEKTNSFNKIYDDGDGDDDFFIYTQKYRGR